MNIAVITGASSGIGREFVLQLDKAHNFDEIWVISRSAGKMSALENEVRAKIRVIALDLTKMESISEYSAILSEQKPNVTVLVNASGFGRFGAFCDVTLEDQLEMIDLNDKALVAMTYATLPYMTEGGQIYQMGSLSSFQPVPYIGVYGASKAFVLSFSRALNVELKSRKIKVMAVSPGWVKTDFFDRAATDNTITYYNKFFTPQQVVTRALSDMKKGRDVSIVGFSIRAQVLFTKLMHHKLVMWIWCRQQKKV